MTVVGVVEDVRHYGLERPMRPGVYFPYTMFPGSTMTAALRSAGDPAALATPVRTVMRQLDPELALFQVRTMAQAYERSMRTRTAYSWMLVVFASVALLLALAGAYGVTSYVVTQRIREIGIRVALGARTVDVIRGVLAGSLAVAGVGLACGVVASIGAARLLSSLLFGVSPYDGVVLTAAAGLLMTTALAANYAPARRAARVDPTLSLRSE
jgi:putative ABC transport system permease protein